MAPPPIAVKRPDRENFLPDVAAAGGTPASDHEGERVFHGQLKGCPNLLPGGRMKLLRLVVATGLMTAVLGLAPAHATQCTKPGQPCGGCHINREMSTEDLRPIVCYA
jgi:hypothetical protein